MNMTENITYHSGRVSRDDRVKLCGTTPQIVWLTGLSGSGKSTVAVCLEKMLTDAGFRAYLLDGDNLRFGLNAGLGFSEEDRTENIRRIAEAARLIADSGCIALVSAISPMKEMRDNARKIAENAGIGFTEVFVNTPVEECARRDVKGLYKKAFAGEIKNFTGVSAPYEAPESPDVRIDWSSERGAEAEAADLFGYILERQLDRGHVLEVMKSAAIKAGEKILEIYSRDFSVEIKDDKSPLTEADLAANGIITEILTEEFPYIALLTEENEDNISRMRSRFCFVVDPLDGTKEFIKRNGEFTVNIALTEEHRSVMGVIYVPVTGELYYAREGHGAYRSVDGNTAKLNVSERTDGIIMMESRSHSGGKADELSDEYRAKVAQIISAGSSLKGCRIAEGRADVYYRHGPTMEWDTAAMQIICEEAGAIFRQLDGYDSPMYYNRTHTRNDMGFYIVNRKENIQ